MQVRVSGGVDDDVVDRKRGKDEGDEEKKNKCCQKGQRFAEVNVKVEGDEGRNDCDGVVVIVERHRLGELRVVLGTFFYNFLSAMYSDKMSAALRSADLDSHVFSASEYPFHLTKY